jgi:hypothetical protein
MCLRSRCPGTALVYPPISRLLHSNGSTRYSIFIKGLCAEIHFSLCLQSPDYRRTFFVITSADDFKLLQSDINRLQKQCTENYMTIDVLKMSIIHFTCRTNSIHFNCYSDGVSIVRIDFVKDLGVMFRQQAAFSSL